MTSDGPSSPLRKTPVPSAACERGTPDDVKPEDRRSSRDAALVNGILMALGATAFVDNIVAHWILELHRAVPGDGAREVEVGLVMAGAVAFVVGLGREVSARRRR